MNTYLTEAHSTILGPWQNVMAYFTELMERYIRGLQAIDANTHAIIDLDYLGDFADAIFPVANEFNNLYTDIISFMNTNRDLPVSLPSNVSNVPQFIAEDLVSAKKPTEEQRFAMGNLDYNFQGSLADVERMLNGILQASHQNLLGNNSIIFRPGSFRNNRIYNQIGISQNMRDNMAKRYFDANDNLDHFRVGFTIFTGHEHGLSDLELQVLLQTFNNQPNSNDAILQSYGMAYLIKWYAQHSSGSNDAISPNDDFRNALDAMLRAGGMMNGTPPFTSNSVALQQLANASFAKFFDEYLGLRAQGGSIPDSQTDNLSDLLSQAQFLAFLNSVGLNAPSFAFDISNFGGVNGGHILFYGNPFHASGINSFISNNYAGEVLERLIREGLANTGESVNIWTTLGTMGSIGLTIAGYITGLGPIHKFMGAASSASGVVDKINKLIADNNVNLTQEEQSLLNQLLALSIYQLGGGVATIQTPNGYVVVGENFTLPGATINLAGLYHVHGFTFGDALAALQGGVENNPNRDIVMNFIRGDDTHERFVYRLNEAFTSNLAIINSRFGSRFTINTCLTSLPPEVLEYVISLIR